MILNLLELWIEVNKRGEKTRSILKKKYAVKIDRHKVQRREEISQKMTERRISLLGVLRLGGEVDQP